MPTAARSTTLPVSLASGRDLGTALQAGAALWRALQQ
jgi:hypothetical protein